MKYCMNDPIEPSQLGMAVCDALDKFAPHITHPEMTAELEEEMDNIAEGRTTKAQVVDTSRNLLSEQLASLLPHSEEVKEAPGRRRGRRRYVARARNAARTCSCAPRRRPAACSSAAPAGPTATSRTAAEGQGGAVPEPCPTCGMPQVKVTAFRSKPRTICIDPHCSTNQEPDVVVGECPACKEKASRRS